MNKALKKNTKNFNVDYKFYGWGRKKSGRRAVELAKQNNSPFLLLEDGFIRSIGLGEDEAFSIVRDDIGIYYDATSPSKLEKILKEENLTKDLDTAKEAISLIKTKKISKYNNGSLILPEYLKNNKQKVLIIAQTKGDMSLEYGLASEELAKNMLKEALNKNPNSEIYLKVHPDVLAGKKESNIDLEYAKNYCKIIDENIHPVVLLEAFDKVYTQTSQMGFEALLLGKETHIFGAPFYVGWDLDNLIWHLDEDKKEEILKRRGKKLSIEEVFTGAYILYSQYYNPIRKRESNIIDTILEIDLQRKKQRQKKLYDFLCIGDSHIRIFENRFFRLMSKKFKIRYVPGATAYGISNPKSQTKAYKIFKEELEKFDYKNIVVTLGEVDTSYNLWRISKRNNTPIEKLLKISTNRYKEFLLFLRQFGKVTILSPSLPTVDSYKGCKDRRESKIKTRDDIGVSYEDRVALNQKFSKIIDEWAREQIDIKFIDTSRYTFERRVKSIFMPKDSCDHHYRRDSYALLLIFLMLKREFNE